MRPQDRDSLQRHLEQVLLDLSEASTQGTELDQRLWSVATYQDREAWRRSQRHRNRPNTLLSVLAGSIAKLRSGGDLTEKQLDNVKNILEILATVRGDQAWQFREVQEFAPTGNSLEDLRTRLFQ